MLPSFPTITTCLNALWSSTSFLVAFWALPITCLFFLILCDVAESKTRCETLTRTWACLAGRAGLFCWQFLSGHSGLLLSLSSSSHYTLTTPLPPAFQMSFREALESLDFLTEAKVVHRAADGSVGDCVPGHLSHASEQQGLKTPVPHASSALMWAVTPPQATIEPILEE